MPATRTLAALLVVVLTGPSLLWAGAFSDVVVFGDSLSDVGNIHTATTWGNALLGTPVVPGEGYWEGRFSNGPVWVERLGLQASTPSLLGGLNYAFGGAHTDTSNELVEEALGPFRELGHLGVTSQIGMYVTANGAGPADRLYVAWAGGNDLLDDDRHGRVSTPGTYALNMIANIAVLKELAGARHFLIPNLPPMGLIPKYRGPEQADQAETMNRLAAEYNWFLDQFLNVVESTYADVAIYRLNVFNLYAAVLGDPAAFGLDNITDPAREIDGADPDRYLFWDDIHPTAKGHSLLALAASAILPEALDGPAAGLGAETPTAFVPEPTTILLLSFGAAAALARRRARRPSAKT